MTAKHIALSVEPKFRIYTQNQVMQKRTVLEIVKTDTFPKTILVHSKKGGKWAIAVQGRTSHVTFNFRTMR